MKNFVQQPDGSHLPSAETLARVRANPHKYPNAVRDFARLSGKPEDLVREMIDNPGSSGFWGTAGGIAVDIGQGAMNAGAVAAENLLPDPLNMKQLHRDSPVHQEFIYLNKTGGLAIVPPRPEAVFDKAFWRSMGVDVGGAFSYGKMPTLTELKTVDGQDGWDAYRGLLYQGRVSQDTMASTSTSGDRIGIGKVLIQEGENFADAMKRLVVQPTYRDLTPDARVKVWNAVFNYFKEQAKTQLGGTLVVRPDVFDRSRYGSPLTAPASINDTVKAGHALVAQTQLTKGSPRNLDAIFAIQQ
jgi:hypothetical protein